MARRPLPAATQARIKRKQNAKANRIQAVQTQKKVQAAKKTVRKAAPKKVTPQRRGGGTSRTR